MRIESNGCHAINWPEKKSEYISCFSVVVRLEIFLEK